MFLVKTFCCMFDQSFLHLFDGKYRNAIVPLVFAAVVASSKMLKLLRWLPRNLLIEHFVSIFFAITSLSKLLQKSAKFFWYFALRFSQVLSMIPTFVLKAVWQILVCFGFLIFHCLANSGVLLTAEDQFIVAMFLDFFSNISHGNSWSKNWLFRVLWWKIIWKALSKFVDFQEVW